ncbi:MAG TPA: putative sugar O-methyltransferase [Alphaproteobacteria bacterium]
MSFGAGYTFLRSYLLRDLPEVSFPTKFGEAGWRVGSAIVNYDLTYYLSLIADLRLAGLFDALVAIAARRPAVVLEIGGGFGGLACLIRKLVPNSHYIVVDLPESLVFSVPYLGTLFPQDSLALVNGDGGAERPAVPDFTFVPNHRVDAVRGANLRVDLAVNTMSLDEMAPHQVEGYARLLSEVLADGAFFFEVNVDHVVPPLSRHLRQIAPPSPWARSERAVLWRDTKKIRYWQA